jgi:hypothetical protein
VTRVHTLAAALSLAVLACGLGGAEAVAQTPAIRMACMSSAQQLCPKEVAAMDRKAAQLCLLKHLAMATPGCRDAVQTYKAQHPDARPN